MSTYYNKKSYRTYRKNKYAKRSVNFSKTQKRAIKKMINKEISPEVKYFNSVKLQSDNTFATSGPTSVIYDLTIVPQSTTVNQQDFTRIGDEIKIKALEVMLSLEALGAYASGTIRVLIFQWKPDNSSYPSLSQIYMGSVTGGIDALSQLQPDTSRTGNMVVLYDKLITMANSTDTDQITRKIKVPLKWARKTINYTSGSTSGANHILMIINADKVAVNPDGVRLAFNSRTYFTDA